MERKPSVPGANAVRVALPAASTIGLAAAAALMLGATARRPIAGLPRKSR